MERSSFGTRAVQRILQETLTSVKGRVTPFLIGAIGIVLGYFINFVWLHHNTAKQLAVLGAVSFGGSYGVWLLGVLMVNTFRVPWLLDAESTDLINTQANRAEDAEQKLAEINAARDKHNLFAELMQQGVNFSDQIATVKPMHTLRLGIGIQMNGGSQFSKR